MKSDRVMNKVLIILAATAVSLFAWRWVMLSDILSERGVYSIYGDDPSGGRFIDYCYAETESASQTPAPQATQTAPQQPTAEQQATAIVGQAIQGFLLYAPTTEAQRKLAIDSYNTVKAAMDRLAAIEKPAPVAEGDKK